MTRFHPLTSVSVRGLSVCVPPEVRRNSDFLDRFSDDDIQKMAKMTGILTRHVTDEATTTADLCEVAAKSLLARLNWDPNSIDALLFVTQTPDYVLPATACLLQSKLGLSTQCAALDINLGCSGYVYGLWQASALIASGMTRRVLLLVGDTCTKFCSPVDSSTVFLFGDAGSATALEYDVNSKPMDFVLGSDGLGAPHLQIPAGGYRNPVSVEALSRPQNSGDGVRSAVDLYMNGSEIFNFTIKRVPELYHALIDRQEPGFLPDQVIFHQANGFMLNHLRKKLKLEPSQTPTSIEKYGNTSSASIPLTIAQSGDSESEKNLVLLGFGVGYSWGAARVTLPPNFPVEFVEMGRQ